MNLYSLVGFVLAVVVLGLGLFISSDDVMVFVDYISMFIVIGGTIAAVSISIQLDKLFMLVKIFIGRVLKGKKTKSSDLIANLIRISEDYRGGKALDEISKEVDDPFLREGLEMLGQGLFQESETFQLLKQRADNMYAIYTDDTNNFKSLGKYPPAFGMMGTTIGMIVLLANLGGADAMKKIGPAMGVCLITTLYGVIIANLGIIPVGENLEASTKELYLKNTIILAGLKLIVQKKSPVVIAENLNSFLLPNDRLNWKEVVGRG